MGIMRNLVDRIKAIPREVGQTAVAKIEQGSTEISNAIFSGQSNAYSPVTADRAMSNAASRARFQNRDQSKGIER
jgi:hypothetical protein